MGAHGMARGLAQRPLLSHPGRSAIRFRRAWAAKPLHECGRAWRRLTRLLERCLGVAAHGHQKPHLAVRLPHDSSRTSWHAPMADAHSTRQATDITPLPEPLLRMAPTPSERTIR